MTEWDTGGLGPHSSITTTLIHQERPLTLTAARPFHTLYHVPPRIDLSHPTPHPHGTCVSPPPPCRVVRTAVVASCAPRTRAMYLPPTCYTRPPRLPTPPSTRSWSHAVATGDPLEYRPGGGITRGAGARGSWHIACHPPYLHPPHPPATRASCSPPSLLAPASSSTRPSPPPPRRQGARSAPTSLPYIAGRRASDSQVPTPAPGSSVRRSPRRSRYAPRSTSLPASDDRHARLGLKRLGT